MSHTFERLNLQIAIAMMRVIVAQKLCIPKVIVRIKILNWTKHGESLIHVLQPDGQGIHIKFCG